MKNRKLKYILIAVLLSFILFSNSAIAQQVKKDSSNVEMYRNSINFSVGPGGILILYLPATIFYERMFLGEIFGPKVFPIADVGMGFETHWGGGGPFFIGRYGILVGAGKPHLEIKAGAVYFTNDFGGLQPSYSIGYRGQKPGRNYVFRTGVGWPEAIYVGLGVSF